MASLMKHFPSQLTAKHSPSPFPSSKPLFHFSFQHHHPPTPPLSNNYNSLLLRSSARPSPFTEKHSSERYQRDSWVYSDHRPPNSSCSLPVDLDTIRDNDIALQLPELKRLLQTLRERRANEASGAGGGDKRGPGNVFLVGTGPGDPELLTLKAVRAIESADLLLYDRLVSNDVLELVKADARLLYVGKTAGYHSRTQIPDRALQEGRKDPLFVTEHAADSDSTLVVYMGLTTLPSLVQKLMSHGLPPSTRQRMVFSELKDLATEVQLADLLSPTLIIIGKVVELSPSSPTLINVTYWCKKIPPDGSTCVSCDLHLCKSLDFV